MLDLPAWTPPPPPAKPARRRMRKLLLAGTAAAVLLAAASGTAAVAIPDTVPVEVTGTGTAHIAWYVDGRLVGLEDPAPLPWSRTLPAGVEVRAQLNGAGEITCAVGSIRRTKPGRFPYVVC